jgi:hypothetical protein
MAVRYWLGVLVLLLGLGSCCGAEPAQEQWLVVTAPAFRESVQLLARQREQQGLRVRVLVTTDVLAPAEIVSGKAGRLQARLAEL